MKLIKYNSNLLCSLVRLSNLKMAAVWARFGRNYRRLSKVGRPYSSLRAHKLRMECLRIAHPSTPQPPRIAR
jgi:hypothetical protein